MSFVIGNPTLLNGATALSTPTDQTGNATATQKMNGCAGAITPVVTGRIVIIVNGTVLNASAIADGTSLQISYGTGTAPANAAALAGTQVGGIQKYVASTTAGKTPFCLAARVTGLTLGTAYWIDLAIADITGGTAAVTDVTITAFEV